MQEDFAYFEKLLKKSLIRVMDYEVRGLAVDFGALYYAALTFYWPELISSLPLSEYRHLLDDGVEVVYGGFQDKSVHVATLNPREEVPCAIS